MEVESGRQDTQEGPSFTGPRSVHLHRDTYSVLWLDRIERKMQGDTSTTSKERKTRRVFSTNERARAGIWSNFEGPFLTFGVGSWDSWPIAIP